MKRTLVFISILLLSAVADGATRKSTHALALGETEIRVNVYENAGASVTFFAPHHNEQAAARLAKEMIDAKGGRLVEIESFNDKNQPSRYVKFMFGGKSYTIDPNRIFTDNGRRCATAPEIDAAVKIFAEGLLKIILAPDGRNLRENERFVVAVHNNADVDLKDENARTGDLTAAAFLKAQSSRGGDGHGAFSEQADGVFLSNAETDADNFVFLSTPARVGFFAEKGFNVVVQKAAARLRSMQCGVDDGSLSIYAALGGIEYICLEADGANGALRQRQMLEAVYALLQMDAPAKPETIASQK
jgi:hypothetical protein